MSAVLSHSTIQKNIQMAGLAPLIRLKARENNVALTRLSSRIGHTAGYLQKMIKKTDFPVSLLLILSTHLQTNLLEPYLQFLPVQVRPTKKELELQQKLATLQTQYDALKKERDMLEKIAMK